MLRVSLEQWRMFRAVVQYGGFNQAAQAVYKSQSTIHSAVSKIEQSLGVKLFVVEGRKTRLTEAGEMMLRRANYLLEEAARLETVGQTIAEGIESTLRIAIDAIFPTDLLYQVLKQVSAQYPLLNIELTESVLKGADELIEQAKVDLAISPFTRADGFSEELCQFEFIAIAHPQHALHALQRELTLEDLKSHRQIVIRDSATTRDTDAGWLGAGQRWTVGQMGSSLDLIAQGLGFGWLPKHMIEPHLQQGKVKPLPLKQGARRKIPLYLVFTDGDRLGPAARAFIGELRQVVDYS